jgi:large subunit ribosomal protein L31
VELFNRATRGLPTIQECVLFAARFTASGIPAFRSGPARRSNAMKADIHPKSKLTTVTCTCGNSFEVISRFEKLSVDICSACHPFYTGTQKFVDTAGRVDAFTKRFAWDQSQVEEQAKRKAGGKTRRVAKDLKTELEKKKVFGKKKIIPQPGDKRE